MALAVRGDSPARIHGERRQRIEDSQQGALFATVGQFVVPHPYFGFSQTPELNGPAFLRVHGLPASDWGFIDDGPLVRRRSPSRLIVGIAGGSFAYFLSARSADRLRRILEAAPRFAGRRVEFVRMAIGGFKQPQQLMALNFLQAAGGELDVLINLDGFNEIALFPGAAATGVTPLYPRDWPNLIAATQDRRSLLATGEIALLEQRIRDWATAFEHPILRTSAFFGALWAYRDRRLHHELDAARAALVALQSSRAHSAPYAGHGPPQTFTQPAVMYEQLAEIWRRSSELMDRICRANGIEYFHFLQPNLNLPGSKALSAEERALLSQDRAPYGEAVRVGYPLLQRAGLRLAAEGEAFEDLSGVYRRSTETLYVDSCCHVNTGGYDLAAEAMAERIAAGPP